MAKTIITTPFPSTGEVARKLGVSNARRRRIEVLIGAIQGEADGKRDPRRRGERDGKNASGLRIPHQ